MSFGTIISTILIGPLKLMFEIIFQLANRFVEHPGLSIIFLSLVMNILVLPLYRRADAMQEAARDIDAKLSKGVAHIKKTFSGDERMMITQAYYRQNNYKPTDALNGSVSLLLEIPFFMAAYQFLSHLEVLQGVSLGPIKDLGAPDGLLVIGGIAINVLPVLMTLINVISSALYLKGFPLKTKIQLYGIAAFFLVFLYTSPSGLVFYWTLNNVFSLVKNIFYKLKNPRLVLNVLTSLLGIASGVFGAFFYDTPSVRRKVFLVALGVALQLPAVFALLKGKIHLPKAKTVATPNRTMFILGSLFLTVLVGVLIPSNFIAASPQEFVDATYFHHPLWYIVSSVAMAAGTFLVWMRVFYWLASDKGKVVFDRLVWALCGVTIVNYMFFGTNLGVITSTLQYEKEVLYSWTQQLINLGIVAAVAAVLWLIVAKWKKIAVPVLLTGTLAIGAMAGVNILGIRSSVAEVKLDTSDTKANFNLSTEGKNVVVIMLDRALNQYFPYYMAEKPELAKQFAGFTNYTNTVSFGGATNFAVPSLLGGYEYTPVEINKRDDETLVKKQNEALKVMPGIFSQNGYEVTVCDPPYANYKWIPDLSIYDGMENVKAYNTKGAFNESDADKQAEIDNNHRNFFCLSLMKSMPLLAQPTIYNEGLYNQATVATAEYTVQTQDGIAKSQGMSKKFMDTYNVLKNLSNMTNVTTDAKNTFMFMANDTTHEPMLLQMPDYTPSMTVDNTAFEAQKPHSLTVNGRTLVIENSNQMIHYHAGMAAMMRLGDWFDYLREQGVYDNTKIIIVSDHGRDLRHFMDELYDKAKWNNGLYNKEIYMPLLLMKDFNSEELTYDNTFMTNADVPTLAFKDVVENPVNPYTGKPVNNDEKTAHPQYIMQSGDWDTKNTENNTTFPEALWACVDGGDVWSDDTWDYYTTKTQLKENAFPQ